ncbi:hypothetical protein F7734_55985 [Scytonema sp. UIC 10036]|uniref:hypothetical protein n=1 Tax=Scytonema sp. UIC 10036 TaxID=2304196 RepID=UPI0012DA6850|nr:hypothetical protein [Scytonema sp. UIC 10036]MUH01077.1 hypothetical protein [Scytonema sp. UIC 10036]
MQIAELLESGERSNRALLISRERIIAAFSNRDFWKGIENLVDKKRLLRECILCAVVDEGKVVEVKLRI